MTQKQRSVVVADYNPRWPELFAEERARLLAIAPTAIIAVEHVGSTSVPGLAAKPIVDVLVTLKRFFGPSEIAAVCAAGHEYRGIDDDIQRQYFSKRSSPALHLHCYLIGNQEADRLLLFRDHLRAHPDIAREYEVLKRDLAVRYRDRREAYQDGKTAFVRRIEATALTLRDPLVWKIDVDWDVQRPPRSCPHPPAPSPDFAGEGEFVAG